MASGKSTKCGAAAPEAIADIDPKLEWLDGANNYIIRLNLPGKFLVSFLQGKK
jgi:hypothetical protein